jgi:hypothetical protein
MGHMYISRDIVFYQTVFPFSSLHSNDGARLHDEINFLSLSLLPFNLHYHEGREWQGPADVNPANATDPVAESFLQDSDQIYASDNESARVSTSGMDFGVDPPISLDSQSSASAPTSGFPSGLMSLASADSGRLALSGMEHAESAASARGPRVMDLEHGLAARPVDSAGSSMPTSSATT